MVNTAVLKALSIPVSYLPRSGPVVRHLAPRNNRIVRQRFRCGATFDLDLSDRIQAEAFVRRAYDPPILRWISRRIEPGDLFVDVGANVGMVSFAVAMAGARVLAFEPNPSNCERWQTNLALNPSANAELVQAAVGDGDEPLRMQAEIPGESGWGKIQDGGPIEVPQVALDKACADAGEIAVLKIDVEGYEPAVLRGAERLLRSGRIGAVVAELNEPLGQSAEIIALLADAGYQYERIDSLNGAFVR